MRHYPSVDGTKALCGRADWWPDPSRVRKAYRNELNRYGMCKDCKREIEGVDFFLTEDTKASS